MAKDKETLIAELTAYFPDNILGEITAADQRAQQTDAITEMAHLDDVAAEAADRTAADDVLQTNIDNSIAYTDQEINDLAQASEAAFTYAAYGGMSLSGQASFPDIGAEWQNISVPDVIYSAARGVVCDIPTSTFTTTGPGLFLLTIAGSFEHDNFNAGRTTAIRLYDTVGGAPLADGYQIGIGRNVATTNFSVSVPFDAAIGGTPIRVEIGGGDVISTVNWLAYQVWIHSIGEYRGELI